MATQSRESTQHKRVRRAEFLRGIRRPDKTKVHTASLQAWQDRQGLQNPAQEDWMARARRYSRYSPWTTAGLQNALKRARREERVRRARVAVPSLSDMLRGRPLDSDNNNPRPSLPSAPDFSMENMQPVSGSSEEAPVVRIAPIASAADDAPSGEDRRSADVENRSETIRDEQCNDSADALRGSVEDSGQLIDDTSRVEEHVRNSL